MSIHELTPRVLGWIEASAHFDKSLMNTAEIRASLTYLLQTHERGWEGVGPGWQQGTRPWSQLPSWPSEAHFYMQVVTA